MDSEIRRVIVVSTRPPKAPLSGGMAPAVSLACKNFDEVIWYAVENADGNRASFNEASGGCDACPANTDQILTSDVEGMVVKALQVKAGIWDAHYNKVSNELLWPLLHEHLHRVVHLEPTDPFGNAYVNDRIAQAIAKDLGDNSETPIWIHDYHHFALPAFLRKHGVKNPIVFFSHVPMPNPAEIRALPIETQGHFIGTLKGLLHCDAAVFQTGETARRAMELLGVMNPPRLGFYENASVSAEGGNRKFLVGNYPISIDTGTIMKTARTGTLSAAGQKIANDMVAPNILINFERCDYSKGIIQRMLAFERLLERHPDLRGKIQIVIGAEPTRNDIVAYRTYADSVREISERINGNDSLWCQGKPPVLLQYKNIPHDDVLLLMRNDREGQRKICTVTPFVDGMNLVAKEKAASDDPDNAGVLLLSSGAGAAAELALDGQGAVVYNSSAREMDAQGHFYNAVAPCDDSVEAIYHALLESIRMPQEEANQRCRKMQKWLTEYDLSKWADRHERLFDLIRDARRSPEDVPDVADDPDIWPKGYLEGSHQLYPC